MSEKTQTITLKMVPYEGAVVYGNFTRISRAGLDVSIDIGVLDVHEVATLMADVEAGKIKEPPPIETKIIQRIALSASTFEKFRVQVEHIYKAYKDQGIFPAK